MWPFKRKAKSRPQAGLSNLVFKNGKDLIDYHCKYMTTRIVAESPLAALVLNAKELFGASVPVKINEKGIQTAPCGSPPTMADLW